MRSNLFSAGLCLLLSLTVGCGDNLGVSGRDAGDADAPGDAPGDTSNPTIPMVTASSPAPSATDVVLNTNVSATFSEPMDRSTLATSFQVTAGTPPVAVPGTVVTTSTKAVFWPAAQLATGVTYTATVSVGAKSAAQVALAAPHAWTFTTGSTISPGLAVDLGTAGNFVILAKSGITTVPTSAITGDLGVSPIAGTALVGFSETADATNVFSTSDQVTGKLFAANYAPPTPTNLTTAIGDMEIAYTDASARAPDVTNLGAGMIGTITVAPGVYQWGTGLLIPTSITLDGNATAVWIFQISGDLTIAGGVEIILAGGALPENIFWQVSGQVTAGAAAHLEGVFLTQTAVTLDTGASLDGRLLAQTAVTVRGSMIVEP